MPTIIFTGQHPRLDPRLHGLNSHPFVRLACPGEDDPHGHVGSVTKAVLPLIAGADLVIVQGDTSSALGGALAARMADVPVAHVEAGLRSHHRKHPWPEEEFRIAIDSHSALLFAPTALSAANLRRERAHGRIHVTGNTGIDAVLKTSASARLRARAGDRRRLLVTCHRRENWGEPLFGIAAALREIASRSIADVLLVLHPNPALAARITELVGDEPGIALMPPCSHSETLEAMMDADLVLSDSGGLQEEAAALGVPLLVLRERTERPEAIACGNIELVGTRPERVLAAVLRRLGGETACAASQLFGDGRAGDRIAAILEEWLEERGALSRPMTALPRQSYGW